MEFDKIIHGDVLEKLKTIPDNSVDMCVTSPPYWGLRDYGADGQLGLESSPTEYVQNMVDVFREIRRTLNDDGTLWLNLGDSYAAAAGGMQGKNGQRANREFTASRVMDKSSNDIKPKDLVGIPWRVAFALQADGWWLRSDIIWHKPNPMPESVTDRPTRCHEYMFLLAKSDHYYYDADAIREPLAESTLSRIEYGWNSDHPSIAGSNPEGVHTERMGERFANPLGRNKRDVWTITTKSYREAHFATFPEDLIVPCIKAGSRQGGVVIDPFMGSGTTAYVARKLGRHYVGIELNRDYIKLAEKRLSQQVIF